jgi:hypothetical protein
MLRNAKDLHGLTIRATDGEIGTVDRFHFEDETWAIRSLTRHSRNQTGARFVYDPPKGVDDGPDSVDRAACSADRWGVVLL